MASTHLEATLQTWRRLQDLRQHKDTIVLDGNGLDIASVVAVARYGTKPTISTDDQLARDLDASIDVLNDSLSKNWVIYGVNTGFGGSADTRTDDHVGLQVHLLQFLQSGIITEADSNPGTNSEREPSHVMPLAWVRGSILVRANQSLRGHSAIRLSVLQSLVDLLKHDITPLVPLRGSISASGDLMPMSYIAGVITGNPGISVQIGSDNRNGTPKVVSSPEALQQYGLGPSSIAPKEALGLVNGTAPSAAVASLVLYDTQRLALLSQLLTAFTSECIGGNVEWTHPFVHAVRPHSGQIEVASNIGRFLHGSRFVSGLKSHRRTGDGLWQDRYSTRTAPQWIGPYLEDLLLAQKQVEVELNSTSDNPIIDSATREIYSGGNFQATTITTAMDKARLALQMIGRMLWSQVTEIINPSTNNGLDANLNASSQENYTMKGIDINMSAYMSELAALAHPVSAHVMSAEMHNQGINSLALISARRTMEAVDLVAHMSACHVYVSCQAVELRANHKRFLLRLASLFTDTTPLGVLHTLGLDEAKLEALSTSLASTVRNDWHRLNSNTWRDRIPHVVDAAMAEVGKTLVAAEHECSISALAGIKKTFEDRFLAAAELTFLPAHRISEADVALQLGDGTAMIYSWVRSVLRIPLHGGAIDDPLHSVINTPSAESKKTIGHSVSSIYESLLNGGMMDCILDDLDSPNTSCTNGTV